MPAVIPVATPPVGEMVILALLAVQVPPGNVPDMDAEVPTQTVAAPEMMPDGTVFTVTTFTAAAAPQALPTI